MSDLRLVVFDLGRVLIRICDGWHHACEVAGVPTLPRELTDEIKTALHEVVCAAEVGRIDLSEFARATAPHLGIAPEHVVALSNAYLLGPYPGAADLLDDLASRGVVTACLSNTNANHWRIMTDPAGASFSTFQRLKHRFASHLVRARKPDEAIYAHVERATGILPSQIIFFDDLPENIATARRRGWHGHVIRIDDDPIEQARRHLHDHGLL